MRSCQARLRTVVQRLLERPNDKSPFPARKIPTPSEVAAFETFGTGGPTADNWSVDPSGPTFKSSAWNQKAGEVFVDIIIKQRIITSNDEEKSEVLDWFNQYADRTLRTHYKNFNLGVMSPSQRANIDRAASSGRQLTVSVYSSSTRNSVLNASRSSENLVCRRARIFQPLPRLAALSHV